LLYLKITGPPQDHMLHACLYARFDSAKESFSMEASIPTPPVERSSHTPLEIANICGSISNRWGSSATRNS